MPERLRLSKDFFCLDVLDVAPRIIGKILVKRNGSLSSDYIITEVEAYRGEEDAACHARFGITARNSIMYKQGGLLYVYLIYGMHWMMNIVTGNEGVPQALLIRGLKGFNGPGRITKELGIDESHNGEDIATSDLIWIEDPGTVSEFIQRPRVGIDYSYEPWKSIPWRYILSP